MKLGLQEILLCFVELKEMNCKILYFLVVSYQGENMRDTILINDIIESIVDKEIDFNYYYVVKNMKKKRKNKSKK